MRQHPDIQQKAKEEITRAIGSDRLPEFSDRPLLPYVEAIYREVMRWMPVLPLGVPHSVLSDDNYEGHLIPKGQHLDIVIQNNSLYDLYICRLYPRGQHMVLALSLRWLCSSALTQINFSFLGQWSTMKESTLILVALFQKGS